MELTKKEVLLKHRELWLTVARMTRERHVKVDKYNALKEMGITEPIRFNCFCCEYTGADSAGCSACANCPVKWPGSKYCTPGLFGKWADCEDLELAADLAEQIAHLADPELKKIEVEEMGFTKKDLRAGDILVTRNGNRYIVLHERFVNLYSGWMDPERYSEDLTCNDECNKPFDVMKVYRAKGPSCKPWMLADMSKFNTVFDRKEVKKMTVAEICKELGYDVEVVKED